MGTEKAVAVVVGGGYEVLRARSFSGRNYQQ